MTKLFLFVFSYFSYEDMNFYIFLKDITVATHGQNTSCIYVCLSKLYICYENSDSHFFFLFEQRAASD
jgi:hypothetical protein